jgi:acetaldehyde dehydrogenase (acetylating)
MASFATSNESIIFLLSMESSVEIDSVFKATETHKHPKKCTLHFTFNDITSLFGTYVKIIYSPENLGRNK